MAYKCKKCGKTFQRGAFIIGADVFCSECWRTPPLPRRRALIREIAEDLIRALLDSAPGKLSEVKMKHETAITEHDIKDDEILDAVKRRLMMR